MSGTGLEAALKKHKIEEAARLIEQAVEAGKVRAAALEVRQAKFRFARSFGEAPSPDAVFLIASITKPMAVAGVTCRRKRE